MTGKSWVAVLAFAILTRLMLTDGGPLRRQPTHRALRGDHVADREREIDWTYNRLREEKRDRGPLPNAASRGNTAAIATDVGSASEPKYHYEVHRVHHKLGHFTSADQKLQTVLRSAAAVAKESKNHPKQQHPIPGLFPLASSATKNHRFDDEEKENADVSSQAMPSEEEEMEDDDNAPLSLSSATYQRHGSRDQITDFGLPSREMNDREEPYSQKKSESTVNDRLQPDNIDLSEDVPIEARDSYQGRPDASENENLADDDQSPVALARADSEEKDSPVFNADSASSIADVYFLAVVIGCSVAGVTGLLLAGVCWYRLHKKIKAASEVDYPAYGVTGPAVQAATTKEGRAGSPGDRKLAQSAQMYHYQHQKQQMIASERLSTEVNQHVPGGSDVESEEENEEGDYTVFECPGLATNGEMEVRNPLFNDQTPVSTPADTSQQTRK